MKNDTRWNEEGQGKRSISEMRGQSALADWGKLIFWRYIDLSLTIKLSIFQARSSIYINEEYST